MFVTILYVDGSSPVHGYYTGHTPNLSHDDVICGLNIIVGALDAEITKPSESEVPQPDGIDNGSPDQTSPERRRGPHYAHLVGHYDQDENEPGEASNDSLVPKIPFHQVRIVSTNLNYIIL